MNDQELREQIRQRYAAAALAVTPCCGDPGIEAGFGAGLYGAGERAELPAEAVAASLGCGNPTAVAELREGERVLDLGSGGGIDVLLSARRVGPRGKAYGLDMTEEMLTLARANAARAGAANVEFLKGTIESIPLPAASVDVVISNCVINLSVDKSAVFAETFRVLTPGGRLGVSDVVADDALTPAQRAERGDFASCIAGALSFTEYRTGLTAAGFTDVSITSTHEVGDGLHAAVIRATKPVTAAAGPEPGGACCGVSACCAGAERPLDPTLTVAQATSASGLRLPCLTPAQCGVPDPPSGLGRRAEIGLGQCGFARPGGGLPR
ncbi:arsenite methyltransferase [Nonomuraea sp. SYSU D8015]|uniref:arsenite methyltransferase n=1 Tax=Nonomuraea sp. SYSU D8015 TaxID=2593644 RepID=UPI00166178E9|nr:arsenite methyltransferase [Nonomuraea sp. SYSU D8015]